MIGAIFRNLRVVARLAGFLVAGVRLFVRQGSRACLGSKFSALIDRGFQVFGALGCVVVLGVRDSHRWMRGGRDFGCGFLKFLKSTDFL